MTTTISQLIVQVRAPHLRRREALGEESVRFETTARHDDGDVEMLLAVAAAQHRVNKRGGRGERKTDHNGTRESQSNHRIVVHDKMPGAYVEWTSAYMNGTPYP